MDSQETVLSFFARLSREKKDVLINDQDRMSNLDKEKGVAKEKTICIQQDAIDCFDDLEEDVLIGGDFGGRINISTSVGFASVCWQTLSFDHEKSVFFGGGLLSRERLRFVYESISHGLIIKKNDKLLITGMIFVGR